MIVTDGNITAILRHEYEPYVLKCTDLHINVYVTAGNTMDGTHLRLLAHTRVQVARGRWGGGVPFSKALSPAELPWKQAMAGNNRRKKSWGLLHHLHELCFCHCLYMDIVLRNIRASNVL